MARFKYVKAPKLKETTVEIGVGIHSLDLKTLARAIPCQAACPTRTNVPGYIEHIAKGEHDLAYRMNQEDNVFPGVLGRICTRVCEDACRYNWTNVEGPVQICHLKRYAADHITSEQTSLPAHFETTGKRVAIVGGGPAGLSAARELARMGHQVRVYEQSPVAGGMLVDGIPAFRLPRDVVAAEINLIKKNGVEIQVNAEIDDTKIVELHKTHDAVLVATGTTLPQNIAIDGVHGAHIQQSGLSFMQRYNRGQMSSVSGNVVVVGGGFTAVDCARAAKRIADNGAMVTIAYRRTEASMAADQNEFKAMEEENVLIRTLVSPLKWEKDSTGKGWLVVSRNMVEDGKLGVKATISPIAGSELKLPCDTLILAIGQKRDISVLPTGTQLLAEGKTSIENLFTCGDFEGGSADVISAVASGKEAARRMDIFLMNACRLIKGVQIESTNVDGETGRYRDHDIQWPLPMPMSPVERRLGEGAEVEVGFTEQIAQVAATRCYLCQYKFEIDSDLCIHCNWCIEAAPRDCIKKATKIFYDKDGFPIKIFEAELSKDATYIYIDNDNCIRCGKCLRVCPTQAIRMRKLTADDCVKPQCGKGAKLS